MQHNPTVFLIDDDTDDQEIFGLAIEKTNVKADCVYANDGIQALEKLNGDESFLPDYIFIDMNMPRMNGQQCLSEIKKIERLKDVPVFMYSTSADPECISENIQLGAEDFIVKPSSISELTIILKRILQEPLLAMMFLMLFLGFSPQRLQAQSELPPVNELKKLSMDELINIVVTSVSKTPENLTEVASAIQVITNNDIKRSAATRLPEALRLTPNLQVAQSGSHDWGISARGFNGAPVASSSLADKLLVMIDGRTVYTPLFGGVYWDVQNVMLEDVDRIEVVSGPGGTLWGSNAVNGVVNVITKSAKESQGLYLTGTIGNYIQDLVGIRYGGQIDSSLFYRLYGQRFDYGETQLPDGNDAGDAWSMTQGGFRVDFLPSSKNTFTLQGEVYGGEEDETFPTEINGQNLLSRWTHSFTETSALSVQAYFDRTKREISNNPFTDELTTADLDIQHQITIKSHHLLYGAGYRVQDDFTTSDDNRFTPAQRTLQQLSAFIQDQIEIVPDRVTVTLGSKFLNNDYTGFEIQPSLRAAWTPDKIHTLWGAVSRAVRTPSRFDVDLTSFQGIDRPDFRSEEVIAYEIGYRMRPFDRVSFSLATFYNQYDDLRSLNTTEGPDPTFYFANDLKANTYGFEISGNILVYEWWRLRGGFTYLIKDFTLKSDNVVDGGELIEGIDPKGQFILHSIIDLTKNFQFDVLARYIDNLPALPITQTPEVDSYITLNARLAYELNKVMFSIAGQNLLEKSNTEFGRLQIPRSVYAKIAIRI